MPTRIALKQSTPAVQPRLRKQAAFAPSLWHGQQDTTSNSNHHRASPSPETTDALGISSSSRRRRSLNFRSSFLREWSERYDDDEEEEMVMATDDIRASPRLLGYLFSMIAGAVMLVSVFEYVVNVQCFLYYKTGWTLIF